MGVANNNNNNNKKIIIITAATCISNKLSELKKTLKMFFKNVLAKYKSSKNQYRLVSGISW